MSTATILIVEDDDWLAEQHVRVLNSAGYNTSVALHALAAIQIIDDINPDAIVLDVLLTGNTAFALLHELQSYGDTGDIPIILCTNLAGELSVDDLEPYGVKKILDKTTMVPDDLITAIKGVLL
jgi:CheY-like chemotaxis protein